MVLRASIITCLCHPFPTPGPWGKHKVVEYNKYGEVSINSTLKWQHMVKGWLTLINDSLRQKFTLPPLVISRRPPTKRRFRKIYWFFICLSNPVGILRKYNINCRREIHLYPTCNPALPHIFLASNLHKAEGKMRVIKWSKKYIHWKTGKHYY